MATKVVLVRPEYSVAIYGATYPNRFKLGMKQVPTPLQLMHIGAAVVDAGHDVRIIDGEAENLDEGTLVQRIVQEQPDILGVTCTTPEYATAKRILETVKRKMPWVVTVVGGAHATHLPWELAVQIEGIDHVVIFEGEKAMAAIADQDRETIQEYVENAEGLLTARGVPLDGLPTGVMLLGENCTTEELERLTPVRSEPHLDMRYYVYSDPEFGLVKTDSVETARGCPFACTFCSSARSGLGMRSVDNVLEELAYLNHRFQKQSANGFVVFLDDTLTVSRPRAFELFEQMERRGFRMRYSGFTRANTIATKNGRVEDLEFAALMKRIGFNTISLGIETGSEEINRAMKKGVTKDDYRRAYDILSQVEFEERRGSFIVGHPYERPETVIESIEFAKELGLHRVGVNIMTPYPGTGVYDSARLGRGLYFEPEARAYDRYRRWGKSVVSTDALSQEALEYWHRRFLAEIYSSSHVLRHSFRRLRGGNLSRFYHRPVYAAIKQRLRMTKDRTWRHAPRFRPPDHSDYDTATFGPAHITKTDCLAYLRSRYAIRHTRVKDNGAEARGAPPLLPHGRQPSETCPSRKLRTSDCP